MTRFPFAVLLTLALALPAANAGAQSSLFDETQRATVEDYFKKQAGKAAEAEKAKKAKEAEKGKAAGKPGVKPGAKPKKPEKPKKPAKPASKDKSKDKGKAKNDKNGKNAKNGDKKKPPPATQLAAGQTLAPDLPRRALPKDLDSQLGKTVRGTQRVIVGDNIVLFERKTGKILDVMEGAVKGVPHGR